MTVELQDDHKDPPRHRWGPARWWLHRWPTALAVGLALLDDGVTAYAGLASALALLPALYVVVAAFGRRRWTWPTVVTGLAGFVALREWAVLDPQLTVLAVAAVALGMALLRGRGGGGRAELVLQGVGLVVFGSVAVLAVTVAPHVAVWLVAVGWFGHGIWDFVHLYRDAVVSRSFAEWCGVVDVIVASQMVLLATSWLP